MSNENDGWETIEVSEDKKEVDFEIEEEEEEQQPVQAKKKNSLNKKKSRKNQKVLKPKALKKELDS